MSYVFSALLFLLCAGACILFRRENKESISTNVPIAAKARAMDKLYEIEKMPKGTAKLIAYEKWQSEFIELYETKQEHSELLPFSLVQNNKKPT